MIVWLSDRSMRCSTERDIAGHRRSAIAMAMNRRPARSGLGGAWRRRPRRRAGRTPRSGVAGAGEKGAAASADGRGGLAGSSSDPALLREW
jgi:hypothetical protein